MIAAIAFNTETLGPAAVNGITTAGLYGFVAVALVLSYRVSRTIAFLHGGILLGGTLLFWYMTAKTTDPGLEFGAGGAENFFPQFEVWPVFIFLVIAGALLGAFYGYLTTCTRLSTYPRVTLTNLSLGFMLIIIGLLFKYNLSQGQPTRTPFGTGKFSVGVQIVTVHQLVMLILLLVLVIGLAVLMQVTRFGIYVRAIADNVNASQLVGVPIGRVGVGVYAISGAVAALGGVLLGYVVGTETTGILTIFLRGLMVCVLGAFGSLPLALTGAVVLAIVDSMMKSDVFGAVDSGMREIVIMGLLIAAVLAIDRFGKRGSSVLSEA